MLIDYDYVGVDDLEGNMPRQLMGTLSTNKIDAKILLEQLNKTTQKEVFLWMQGYTVRDIAKIMNNGVGTTHRHITKALKYLKTIIHQH